MTSRSAAAFRNRALPAVLLWLAIGGPLALPQAKADTAGTISHPVTATPPLQAVPATPASKNVQQRMRGCNAAADAKKLQAAARETFIKSCMAPRRGHALSRPGSQAKPDP
ncbi:MAG TPA: PsiF family protein [Steroidobacteraceae bacterium]|nr:PsiF family protein [Steroidobacteraceae bacterium]